MNKKKEDLITKNVATRAFDYAVYNVICKGNKEKSTTCIERKAGCDIRNTFIKKLG